MSREECIVVDFETKGIQSRPEYPPVPVGVSLMEPGEKKPRYLAWGHPEGNNCSKEDARRVLAKVWRDERPKLFHNGKFDEDVAETHLGLPLLPWNKMHDSLFSLFLMDPYAHNLGLKPSAIKHLGVRARGQELAREWIIRNVPEARRKPSTWGAYICMLPGALAARYAADDVTFTGRLHTKMYKQVVAMGMQAAYDRERKLMPLLLQQERLGIRIHVHRLRRELPLYETALKTADAWVRKQLNAPNLGLDSNDELVEALLKAKVAKAKDFLTTPGGQVSASKASLRQALEGGSSNRLLGVIGYRNRLTTCLGMFMRRWLEEAERTGGTVHPTWHQVRQGGGGDGNIGARSGRLITSDPNLLNLSKDFEDKDDGYVHPKFFAALPELPLVRRYVLPDKGEKWGHRDYNQQELRICAHFEDGDLMRQYQQDDRLDVHTFVQKEIKRISGADLGRRPVKILNFGMLYGQGITATARKLGCSYEEAQDIKNMQLTALPGVKALDKSIKAMGRNREPIRTWGGRLYWAEEPQIKDGEVRRFEYKLLNYLIQGSAADATKEAVLRYHEVAKDGRFVITVYDEINISYTGDREMLRLREAMESVEFDVKLLSDAKVGPSWGELKSANEKRG